MATAPHPHPPSHRHADHGHGHHSHDPGTAAGAVLALGIALNLGFVAVEAGFGVIGHSTALLADAGHNLSDVLGLAAAWGAGALMRRRPSGRYTYGLRSSSILVALFNAIILLITVGAIILEAIQRLAAPQPVAGVMVMIVAAVGIAVNGLTAILLFGHGRNDLNLRGAFLHMAADAAVSLGVVIAAGIILLTGWLWLDPAVSLVIAIVIIAATWRLLRQSLDMALAAVPAGIDATAVRRHLGRIAGVVAVHDLHIWPMSTTETALTCHLVMPAGHPGDQVLARVAEELRRQFAIGHVTLQVETGDPEHPCALVPDHVV